MINTRRRIFLLAFLVEPAGAAFKEAAPTDQNRLRQIKNRLRLRNLAFVPVRIRLR